MAAEIGNQYNSKYDETMPDRIYALMLLGATEEQIAEIIGIDPSTLSKWKHDHPEVSEAIKKGRAQADSEVAESLHKSAKGFEWEEEVAIKCKDVQYENGKKVSEIERIEVAVVRKRVPPNPISIIYWLKNRQRMLWRDKPEVPKDTSRKQRFIKPNFGGELRNTDDDDPAIMPDTTRVN